MARSRDQSTKRKTARETQRRTRHETTLSRAKAVCWNTLCLLYQKTQALCATPRFTVLICLPTCGLLRRNGAHPREMADSRVLATARRIHIRRRVAVLRDSSHFRGFRPAGGGEASRAWHPREFGAVLGVSASLPLHAPPLPSSSRRYAPQCFVAGITGSLPCDVSHRASDEPRRCMSPSSALAPRPLPHLP